MTASHRSAGNWSLKTARLILRPAMVDGKDIAFLYRLWTNPEVMRFVGFPSGLRISEAQIKDQLAGYGPGEFDRVLLVCRREGKNPIGECKLGSPDENGLASTDIKLLPEFWGQGYGTETKRTLVDYLFEQTACRGVRATPNRLNAASIRMQEAVGAQPVSEGWFRFPEQMREYTIDVPYIEYIVFRNANENLPRR